MPPKTWKRVELEVCKLFGGWRSGPEGKQGPDCRGTGHFAVQVKYRKCPKWLDEAVEQTQRDAKYYEEPVLVWYRKGKGLKKALVIQVIEDFEEWRLSK
jgi:hypothetical protein